VEDDPDIAALLRRMLAEEGYNSDIAYDAEEARKFLRENKNQYKAITLDLILPGEDGLSFLESLRKDNPSYDIPVVVISVKADETKNGLEVGAVSVIDWLQKPIDQNRLINAIKNVVGPGCIPRVLHVEDESDVHQIVKTMLQDICEISWTTTVLASREALLNYTFDIVLLDIHLPDGSGLDLLQIIEERVHPPHVIIFSAHDVTKEYADKVSAVLVKSKTSNDHLAKVINDVINKKTF
jgi:DNA-binding response OmpR family regulator